MEEEEMCGCVKV